MKWTNSSTTTNYQFSDDEIEDLNSHILSKDTEFIVKNPVKNKSPGPHGLTGEF